MMMPTITYKHLPIRVNNPGQRMVPREIILHYIGNPGTTAEANAKYFANVDSQTSVHYIVDDTSIIEIIPPTMKSYGTSSREHNEKGIQIEMCHPDGTGKISDKTLENVVWLCRELMGAYGITDIIRHYDVTGKRCPLWYVVHPEEWETLRQRILEGDEEMTQEQFNQMFDAAMLGYLAWRDENAASGYAAEALEKAKAKGISNGDRPKGFLTREDALVLLERCGLLE